MTTVHRDDGHRYDGKSRRRDLRSPFRFTDWSLVLVSVGLGVLGVAVNYAATWRQLELDGDDPYFFARRQAVFVALGVIALVLVAVVDYRFYLHVAREGYVAMLLLLVGVLLLGTNVRGARAWFDLPFGFRFQPSEFGKVVVIVGLAAFLARANGRLSFVGFLNALVISGLPMLLIFRQPDLGTMLVYLAITMGMILIGGARATHLALATVALVGSVSAVLVLDANGVDLLTDAQTSRLTAFVDRENAQPADVFNLEQSEQAIAIGGLTGTGFAEGRQTGLNWVPEQETDFIFTAVGEEFGFVGSAGLLALYALLLMRVWNAARSSADLFGVLACVGVMCMFGYQIVQNIGMTIGIMPITGIPLPFFSHGGSSVIAAYAAVGLVLNVRARRYQP